MIQYSKHASADNSIHHSKTVSNQKPLRVCAYRNFQVEEHTKSSGLVPELWGSGKGNHHDICPYLVGGLEHDFYFPIYWEQSSKLTNIFQGVRDHQPDIVFADEVAAAMA